MKKCWFVGSVVFFFEHQYSENEVSFLALVEVMKNNTVSSYDPTIPVVTMNKTKEQQLLDNPTGVLIDPKFAVINISDIIYQVGLIQSHTTSEQIHSVIAPYYVFNENLNTSAGEIRNL